MHTFIPHQVMRQRFGEVMDGLGVLKAGPFDAAASLGRPSEARACFSSL
jgi:hypothetical protein